jgi:hypothetical protein
MPKNRPHAIRDEEPDNEDSPVETDFIDPWNRWRDDGAHRLHRENGTVSPQAPLTIASETLREQLPRETRGACGEKGVGSSRGSNGRVRPAQSLVRPR